MSNQPNYDSGALQALQRLLAKRKARQPPLFEKYVALFLRQSSITFLSGLAPEALYEFLRERFAFFQRRPAGPACLRIGAVEPATEGVAPSLTLIEILTDDRPFLLDSVQGVLAGHGMSLHAMFHPIMRVARDARGGLTSLQAFDGAGAAEAHLVLVAEGASAAAQRGLSRHLQTTLADVIRCVEDFPAISAKMDELCQELASRPQDYASGKLLRWFQAGNFVFLGLLPFGPAGKGASRRRSLAPRQKGALGVLQTHRTPSAHRRRLHEQAQALLARHAGAAPFFAVEESDELSYVHRREWVSLLLLSTEPAASRTHAWVVAGVFTHHSQRAEVLEIPVLRDKITGLASAMELVPRSHKHKEVLDFLNGMPRQELFSIPQGELREILDFFLSVTDHPRRAVRLLTGGSGGALRVLTTMPQPYFPPEKMEAIRESMEARLGCAARNSFVVRLGTFSLYGLLFRPATPLRIGAARRERLTAEVHRELRTREERLLEAWLASAGAGTDEGRARGLIAALPEDYKVAQEDGEILLDLARLERLEEEGVRQLDLRPVLGGAGVRMVLYDRELFSLSRIMPILTNLRLHVVEEMAFHARLPGGDAHMQFFHVRLGGQQSISPARDLERLRQLLFRVLDQELENDPLNALLFACGFGWRQINLMMLLRNYLMQVGTVYTRRTINETLVRRADATRALYGVFEARFDPHLPSARRAGRADSREEALHDAMQEIDNLTEDRIFKRLQNLILAAVRTNFFQSSGHPVLALKLASPAIDELPTPRPLYEIWVHGPLMEGVHLRGGMIARGGIRYSDRPDDFRTEVLGLMDTQMKKNALVVPVGSKGGFVVKSLAPYQGDARRAGDAQYEVFMRALLSITDNLVQGRVKPPKNTVRHDGDDPYLVVAADKGTAHLSDTANAISVEAGFWMGDAFASGGSNGYDHKGIGITARGAWESVKRHFWELGTDLAKASVRVVGIGDMSGDVFGNGLLLNRRFKLVGAFNHMHIFLDPDPQPEAAFKERQRLFRLPRSAWSDYDAKKISRGGGVFLRNAKAIPLSPQARRLLQVNRADPSGEEVVRALLGLDVDLLWNGGIGTYIKAAEETDAEVGDNSNDAVRINARDCRARVIGEGGNLGLTQAARVAIDQAGGRLSTDAIDNAGGVYMSDQEVNLKILLGELLAAGRLRDLEQRNRLLSGLEGAVTEVVLHGNYLQAVTLSMDRRRSAVDVQPFLRVVEVLAAEGRLDRRAERIPNAQQIQRYQGEGGGIPRPMLAVLLSGIKMSLSDRLEASPLLDEPYLKKFYNSYFPAALRKAHPIARIAHPMERQIKATMITNLVVDQAGIAFVAEMAAYTGEDWPQVVRAYLLADEACGAAAIRDQVYALDFSLPASAQYDVLTGVEEFLADFARDALMHAGTNGLDFAKIPLWRKALNSYAAMVGRSAGAAERKQVLSRARSWRAGGMNGKLAERAAWLPHLKGCLALSRLADAARISIAVVIELEQAIDRRFRLVEVEQALSGAAMADPWQKQFGDGLLRAVGRRRHELLDNVLKEKRPRSKPEAWVAAYLERKPAAWREYEATLGRALTQKQPELIALAVVVEMLDNF